MKKLWTPSASGWEMRLDGIVCVATIFAIASLLTRTFVEPDTWWHIAIGRDILTNWAIPVVDTYTVAGYGRSYHDSHWLFQVILALADRYGGMKAVGSVHIFAWSITLTYCYRAVRTWVPVCAGCVLVMLVALACDARFIPRPDIISCLMVAIFYYYLQAGRFKSNFDLILLFLLQVIWSNSHGLFVIGPFLAICYFLSSFSQKDTGFEGNSFHLLRLVCVVLVATLFTPFGLNGWRYALLLATEAGPAAHPMLKGLTELLPTFSKQMLYRSDFWAFLLFLTLLLYTAIMSIIRKQRMPWSRLAIVVPLLITALLAQRNIPLFALTAAPLVAEGFWLRGTKSNHDYSLKIMVIASLLCVIVMTISGHYYRLQGDTPVRFGVGVADSAMPDDFPSFLRSIQFDGVIYNNDIFGGFCIYNGITPLIDSRWEIYDINTLIMIQEAPFSQSAWESVLARYPVKGVLLKNGSERTKQLGPKLFANGSFSMVYQDAVATFWLKK